MVEIDGNLHVLLSVFESEEIELELSSELQRGRGVLGRGAVWQGSRMAKKWIAGVECGLITTGWLSTVNRAHI